MISRAPKTNGQAKRFLLYHLPALGYAGIIITVSSIPNLNAPEVKFLMFDKVAHFVEYGLFTLLVFRSFSHFGSRMTGRRSVLFTILFLSLFACLDEFYQRFVPGRHSELADLAVDFLGIVSALVFVHLRSHFRRPVRQQ